MKKLKQGKLLSLLTLIAVAFVLIACPGDEDGNSPVIENDSLPLARTGEHYYAQLNATGDKPITWSLDGGQLPPGLYLDENGCISGMINFSLNIDQVYEFYVKAENAAGSDTKYFAINIQIMSCPHNWEPIFDGENTSWFCRICGIISDYPMQ